MPIMRRALFAPPPSSTGTPETLQVASDAFALLEQRAFEQYETQVRRISQERGTEAGVNAAIEGVQPDFAEGDSIAAAQYNAALVNGYMANAKQDIADAVARASMQAAEKGYDLDQFDAVISGYREGAMQGMDRRMMPLFETELQIQARGARRNVEVQHRTRALERADTAVQNGISLIERQITLAAEDLDFEEVQRLMDSGDAMLSQHIMARGGDEQQVIAWRVAQGRAALEGMAVGEFRAAMAAGDGSHLTILREVGAGEGAYEQFTEEERAGIQARFETMLADAQEAQQEAEKRRDEQIDLLWEENKGGVVMSWLNGTLTRADLNSLISENRIDPDFGVQMAKVMDQSPVTNPDTLMMLQRNPFQWTEPEIVASTELSRADKMDLFNLRDDMLSDRRRWRSTQAAQDGLRSIRGQIGVTEDTMSTVDPKMAQVLSQAETRWYDSVESWIKEQGGYEQVEDYEIGQAARRLAQEVSVTEIRVATLERQLRAAEDMLRSARSDTTGRIAPEVLERVEQRVRDAQEELDKARAGQ